MGLKKRKVENGIFLLLLLVIMEYATDCDYRKLNYLKLDQ